MVCVLAFSLQGQVDKIGAYLGIASFLGLALLSVLYFSQARELRRLRDWAGRAPERDRELEDRVSAQADERRVQPAPARGAAAQPAGSAAPAAAVGVGAGAGAQAPGPAAVPQPANGRERGPLAVPMAPRPATAAAAVAAAVGAVDEASAVGVREPGGEPQAPDLTAEPGGEPQAPEPGTAAAAAPEPGTAAGAEPQAPAAAGEPPADPADPAEAPAATNGHGDQETSEHAVAEAAPIPRATPRPAPRRAPQPLRSPQRSATMPPRRTAAAAPPRRRPPAPQQPAARAGGRGPSTGILLGALAGLVVVAVAALFATGVLGGGSGDQAPAPRGSASPAPPAGAGSSSGSASSSASRAAATVVVLNGTTVDGLAAGEKTKLEQLGYRDIQTTNSQNQAEARSSVTYASGQRGQAMDVGKALAISTVIPLDADTQALANNSFAKPVQADVVVLVGADQSP